MTAPRWHCQNADTAWLGPDVDELCRILEGKSKKAKKYNLGGAPLWLLVDCATGGDLQSHIFPTSTKEMVRLAGAVNQTGFDFAAGPFAEVWLLSAIGEGRVRLYPGPA